VNKPRDYHSFGLLAKDDTLTFVGALFADQCPIYQSRVFCTRWNGLKKGGLYVDALDSDEFQSSAISLLNDSLKFVRHNSSIKWKKTGKGRVEMPDYPPEAIHEALVNALVHRDYMVRGSGLRKIIDEYPEYSAPIFRSTEQSFIVKLKNLNYNKISSPPGDDVGVDNGDDIGEENNVDKIFNALSTEPKATQKRLSEITRLSPRTISRVIKELRNTNTIKRIGSDRAGYWEIVK
jgi:predicted HTH transcriptional regulator